MALLLRNPFTVDVFMHASHSQMLSLRALLRLPLLALLLVVPVAPA